MIKYCALILCPLISCLFNISFYHFPFSVLTPENNFHQVYLIVIAVCRYAREDTHYLLYIYDLMRLRLVNGSSCENDLLLEVFFFVSAALSLLPYLLSNFTGLAQYSLPLVFSPRLMYSTEAASSATNCRYWQGGHFFFFPISYVNY